MTSKTVLSSKQRAALESLATGATQREAAEAAGVKERAVRRYVADPHFVAALRAAQDAALGETVRRMASGTRGALDVLTAIMDDKTIAAGVRLRAADLWLQHTWRARELQDLAERIAAIEGVINDANQRTS